MSEEDKAREIEQRLLEEARKQAIEEARKAFEEERKRIADEEAKKKADELAKAKDLELENLRKQIEEDRKKYEAEIQAAKLKPGFDEGSKGVGKNEKPTDNKQEDKPVSKEDIIKKLKETPAWNEETGWKNLGLK